MRTARLLCLFVLLPSIPLLAQTNPVPFVNQPLVPMATTPGGAGFTVTVNGTGFASGSVVQWNGTPLVTTFVTSSQLTAAVPGSDIATAGTASVTVVSPGPGGGTSNVQYFDVTSPAATLTFANVQANDFYSPTSAQQPDNNPIAADFNGDGKLDLAAITFSNYVAVQLGNGDGSFQAPVTYAIGQQGADTIAVGDFRGNGKLDIVAANYTDGTVSVLLGNGDGTFRPQTAYATASSPAYVVVGDFNGDGKLDIAVETESIPSVVSILLGNGDGTFQSHVDYDVSGSCGYSIVGDFNGDGQLDLACAVEGTEPGGIAVLIGNGDGTFQVPPVISGGGLVYSLITADVNGDGKLDLIGATDSEPGGVDVFLGNGDGTFQAGVSYTAGSNPLSAAAADVDGDGNLDLIVANGSANSVSVLLGNGDGTFQPAINAPTNIGVSSLNNSPQYVVAGDFNGDGKLDSAVVGGSGFFTILLQGDWPALLVYGSALQFGPQPIGSTSAAQTASLINTGTATLTISSIAMTGPNSGDFAETNTCGATLAPAANCPVNVTFTPSAAGTRSATVLIANDGPGSPGTLSLTGTTPPAPVASLSPLAVTFPAQYVGTSGLPQTVTLTNTGSVALTISSATASPGDFGTLSTCGSTVAAGSSCAIGVFFDPSATGTQTGTLTVSDNANNSPQTVTLSGTGQDFSLAPSGASSATVSPGQTAGYTVAVSPGGGFSQTVSLACSGAPAMSTCSVSPSSVTLSGSAATSVSVSVTTAGNSARLMHPGAPLGGSRFALWFPLFGLPCIMLVGIWGSSWQKRRSVIVYGLALLCLLSVSIGLPACSTSTSAGNTGGNGGTPAGTYNLTVSGSFSSGSTNLTHTQNLTLVVQ